MAVAVALRIGRDARPDRTIRVFIANERDRTAIGLFSAKPD